MRSSELGDFGPLVTPAFGPHAIYTVSGESLRWLAETARRARARR